MKKNNLYTKSYFIKRLKDNDIYVYGDCITYPKEDIRQWTIILSNEMILCTCYKLDPVSYWFKFDSQQKSNVIVSTMSMEIIIHNVDLLVDGSKVYKELRKNGI